MRNEHQVKECSTCSEDKEHEGIEQSCQICKKKSPVLMTMNPFVGGWYHPWQREDHRGIFFGIKCNDCIKKYPAHTSRRRY